MLLLIVPSHYFLQFFNLPQAFSINEDPAGVAFSGRQRVEGPAVSVCSVQPLPSLQLPRLSLAPAPPPALLSTGTALFLGSLGL